MYSFIISSMLSSSSSRRSSFSFSRCFFRCFLLSLAYCPATSGCFSSSSSFGPGFSSFSSDSDSSIRALMPYVRLCGLLPVLCLPYSFLCFLRSFFLLSLSFLLASAMSSSSLSLSMAAYFSVTSSSVSFLHTLMYFLSLLVSWANPISSATSWIIFRSKGVALLIWISLRICDSTLRQWVLTASWSSSECSGTFSCSSLGFFFLFFLGAFSFSAALSPQPSFLSWYSLLSLTPCPNLTFGSCLNSSALDMLPFSSMYLTKLPMCLSHDTVSALPTITSILRALVTATFMRLQSLRKPISPFALLRTREMRMHSFSRPWMPSTVETSGAISSALPRRDLTRAACLEQGVRMATCWAETLQASSLRQMATARSASPTLNLDSLASPSSPIPQPAVSTNSRLPSSGWTAWQRSRRVWSATEGWARSCSPQNCELDQPMMLRLMRYWVLSMVEGMSLSSSIARVKRVWLSSESPRLCTVGGSCLWSPASTTLRPLSIGIQHATSRLCPHSSITTSSKVLLGRQRRNTRSAAPVLVQQTTSVSLSISSMVCSWSWWTSSLIWRISLASCRFSCLEARLNFFLTAWSRLTSPFHSPPQRDTCTSRQRYSTDSIMRAGLPILMQLTLLPSPSTMLSTEMFEGPQASTFSLRATASRISWQTVVVLPVPGGPCSRWMRSVRQCFTAVACSSLSLAFVYSIASSLAVLLCLAGVTWSGKKSASSRLSDCSISSRHLPQRRKVTSFHLSTMLQLRPSRSFSSSISPRTVTCSLGPARLETTPSVTTALLRKRATSSPTCSLHSSGISWGFLSEWQVLVRVSTVLPQQPRLLLTTVMLPSPYPSASISAIVLWPVIASKAARSDCSSCLSRLRVWATKSCTDLQLGCPPCLPELCSSLSIDNQLILVR